jgi:hypothetical protein
MNEESRLKLKCGGGGKCQWEVGVVDSESRKWVDSRAVHDRLGNNNGQDSRGAEGSQIRVEPEESDTLILLVRRCTRKRRKWVRVGG